MKPISTDLTELKVQQIPVFVIVVLRTELPSMSATRSAAFFFFSLRWLVNARLPGVPWKYHFPLKTQQRGYFAMTRMMLAYHRIYRGWMKQRKHPVRKLKSHSNTIFNALWPHFCVNLFVWPEHGWSLIPCGKPKRPLTGCISCGIQRKLLDCYCWHRPSLLLRLGPIFGLIKKLMCLICTRGGLPAQQEGCQWQMMHRD